MILWYKETTPDYSDLKLSRSVTILRSTAVGREQLGRPSQANSNGSFPQLEVPLSDVISLNAFVTPSCLRKLLIKRTSNTKYYE